MVSPCKSMINPSDAKDITSTSAALGASLGSEASQSLARVDRSGTGNLGPIGTFMDTFGATQAKLCRLKPKLVLLY